MNDVFAGWDVEGIRYNGRPDWAKAYVVQRLLQFWPCRKVNAGVHTESANLQQLIR